MTKVVTANNYPQLKEFALKYHNKGISAQIIAEMMVDSGLVPHIGHTTVERLIRSKDYFDYTEIVAKEGGKKTKKEETAIKRDFVSDMNETNEILRQIQQALQSLVEALR